VDFEAIAGLGKPFWIGGGITSPEHVRDAIALGASGVQVGTLFAYCDESGMDPDLRRQIIRDVKSGTVKVKTSLRASSTGYPFKVASVDETISQDSVYDARERRCDLGYLREAYLTPTGSTGYRCAAEPVEAYVRKGGSIEATDQSTCLCNGLMATCGLGQFRVDGRREAPVVTSGDALNDIRELLVGRERYGATDVIAHLRGDAVAASSA
jgi:NAD(P)H-dependent flavin oxidoreductase YrpB (nitropropane dioxygenase family)